MTKLRSTLLRTVVTGAIALAAAESQGACTFGGSGEPSLQGTFNTLLGADALSATNDCIADGSDVAWTTLGTIGEIDIVIELAGDANTNVFGIYDLANPNNRITVFEGNDAAGAEATVRLRNTVNGWQVRVQELNNPSDPNDQHPGSWDRILVSTTAFGFYLATANNGTFFSNTALNADGADHLFAYQGTGTPFVSGFLQDEFFNGTDYILAWEDLAGLGDADYQDFVLIAKDMNPVPLPTAVWLLASGLIGLAGVARRRT
jgi:hypothetical protein